MYCRGRFGPDCDNLSLLVYVIILLKNVKPLEVSKPKATTRPMLQKDDSSDCLEDKQRMLRVRGETGEAGKQGRPVSQDIHVGQ